MRWLRYVLRSEVNLHLLRDRYLNGLEENRMALVGPFSHWRHIVLIAITLIASQTATRAETRSAASTAKPAAARPAAASESEFSKADEAARRQANDSALTILASGRQTGHAQYAEDISNVIEGIKGNDLRVLPVLGRSESENVFDMLYLKGADMAIVDRDVLANLKHSDPVRYRDIDKKINYIAKLFNTALHVYARDDVKSLEDLRGKKISCLKAGSTIDLMCRNLFRILNIDAQIVNDDFGSALQKVKAGEIAAAASGASPPIPGFEAVRVEDGLHFVPIDSATLPKGDFKSIWASYLPLRLTHDDYPNMIPEGKDVPTISTTTLLAVYAWPAGSAKQQRIQRFVKLLFENVRAFRQPPRHPKWKDINLATEVRGWTRFPAARDWLEAERKATATKFAALDSNDAKMKASFAKFLEEYAITRGVAIDEGQRENLYALFVKWWQTMKKQQGR
jgi:TRAP-type uncharacterized transport system substrate-binding protein